MKKNVIFGKFGKTIKFKGFDALHGGQDEIILLSTFAKLNPDWTFYLIGPNQLNKLTDDMRKVIFPHNNVVSVFTHNQKGEQKYDECQYIVDYFKDNNINVDFALMTFGMSPAVSLSDFITKKSDDSKKVKPMILARNYSGPYVYVLNKLNCPWYLISIDPRFINTNMDLYNMPRLVLTQSILSYDFGPHIKSETDHTIETTNVKAVYTDIDKVNLNAWFGDDWKNIDFDRKLNSTGNKFIVLSNGHGFKKNEKMGPYSARFPGFKQYIIDGLKDTKFEGTKIYGIWNEKIYNKYPQFENKEMVEVMDEIKDAKYTLVYSIEPGFVTWKIWEDITLGLIPFIHPEYDKDHLLDVPEYLYIKDVDDLKQKLNELENDDEKYKQLMLDCIASIKPEYQNGLTINNSVMQAVANDLDFEYENKTEGVEPIIRHWTKEIIY